MDEARRDPSDQPRADLSSSSYEHPVAPTHEDPFVRAGSAVFGGPLGRHAHRGWSWWTPLRVLIGIALASCVLGYA
ncbi:MAG TPA: hypothetical protein VIL94_03425, partial [Acidothermaceae bacterium]